NAMHIINKNQSHDLYNEQAITKKMSGGSAANTAAGLSSLGLKVGFIGKTANDEFGQRFVSKLESRGIKVILESEDSTQFETGHCFILKTPDNSRTMCTYPGIGSSLSANDINEDDIKSAKVIFITGFLWDSNSSKEAAKKTISLAQKHNIKIAFALSDFLCVKRHREEFLDLVNNHAYMVFGNKKEIKALFDVDDHSQAVEILKKTSSEKDLICVLTCSSDGAIIINKGESFKAHGVVVPNVVDTTGVGALFASGFIYGYIAEFTLKGAAEIANIIAAQGLLDLGARSQSNLQDLLKDVALDAMKS
ncbi:adenosine kinase, partial [Rickettsiales bacterium]|nr:adenosine kinase [Rickettsiales bacterium]